MAIQFHCPYCTSSIRVPDSAAGKMGSCPRCGTQLLVPKIDVPRRDTPSSSTPAVREDSPETTEPLLPGEHREATAGDPGPALPAHDEIDVTPNEVGDPSSANAAGNEDELPFFEPSPSLPGGPTTPVAKALRKRRRTRGGNFWIPLLFGSLLAGVVVFFSLEYRPRLTGELTAVAPADVESLSGSVERAFVDLPPETINNVLEALAEQPIFLKSKFMDVELRGARRGIQVTLREGPATQFYRIDVNSNVHLRRYRTEHAAELLKPRQRELEAAARDFFLAHDEAADADTAVLNLSRYRDQMALNALVGGLGHHLEAVVDQTLYRCVYEDADGRLYFLLPRGTQTFELRGRQLADKSRPFPGHYTVTVSTE